MAKQTQPQSEQKETPKVRKVKFTRDYHGKHGVRLKDEVITVSEEAFQELKAGGNVNIDRD